MANYFCKNCGEEFSGVSVLTSNKCVNHPTGPGKGPHELY